MRFVEHSRVITIWPIKRLNMCGLLILSSGYRPPCSFACEARKRGSRTMCSGSKVKINGVVVNIDLRCRRWSVSRIQIANGLLETLIDPLEKHLEHDYQFKSHHGLRSVLAIVCFELFIEEESQFLVTFIASQCDINWWRTLMSQGFAVVLAMKTDERREQWKQMRETAKGWKAAWWIQDKTDPLSQNTVL